MRYIHAEGNNIEISHFICRKTKKKEIRFSNSFSFSYSIYCISCTRSGLWFWHLIFFVHLEPKLVLQQTHLKNFRISIVLTLTCGCIFKFCHAKIVHCTVPYHTIPYHSVRHMLNANFIRLLCCGISGINRH